MKTWTLNQLFALGNVVILNEPYKPAIGFNAGAFTHGIIVEHVSRTAIDDGDPRHVSLHLYNGEEGTIYMSAPALGLPTYVDYHVAALQPLMIAGIEGYCTITKDELPYDLLQQYNAWPTLAPGWFQPFKEE